MPGYFGMSDNSNWVFDTKGGGDSFADNGDVNIAHIENASLSPKQLVLTYRHRKVFNWDGPFILDNDWVYILGPTNHPDLDPDDSNGKTWLGANIRAYKVRGQEGTPENQNLDLQFLWENIDSFIANEGIGKSDPKAWCLGKNYIYLITQGGVSHTPTDADVNFSELLVLNAVNKTNNGS